MITQKAAEEALSAGDRAKFDSLTAASPEAWELLPEVQVAIDAATKSAQSSIAMAYTMNSLRKIAEGKAANGRLTSEAQDCLRSALLFSGAGLDTALKRLVQHAVPTLIGSEAAVETQFQDYSKKRIQNKSDGVDPKELMMLLLSEAKSPREVLLERWVYDLRAASAQSASRVMELATACGVAEKGLRRRFTPTQKKTSLLEQAFTARNEIAHELDVTEPAEGARKALEQIRAYRKAATIQEWCQEILDITQDIINDVARRLKETEASQKSV
ncbi:hypothetical protein ACFUPZ_07470 [Microbacterium oxydans]|uniref:hypothetical protein n=1 Tax=Microbacterium oxydans TaxID=82380 RepID=UPI00363CDED0